MGCHATLILSEALRTLFGWDTGYNRCVIERCRTPRLVLDTWCHCYAAITMLLLLCCGYQFFVVEFCFELDAVISNSSPAFVAGLMDRHEQNSRDLARPRTRFAIARCCCSYVDVGSFLFNSVSILHRRRCFVQHSGVRRRKNRSA